MSWTIKWDARVQKDLKKIDRIFQKKIIKYMEKQIAPLANPRSFGKALLHEKFGLWRYRVEDYRIICRILDNSIEILVIQVGHRKNVYEA